MYVILVTPKLNNLVTVESGHIILHKLACCVELQGIVKKKYGCAGFQTSEGT